MFDEESVDDMGQQFSGHDTDDKKGLVQRGGGDSITCKDKTDDYDDRSMSTGISRFASSLVEMCLHLQAAF